LLLHCKGYDFYSFADQDDYWMQGKLHSAVQSIVHETGPAVACANGQLVGADLESLGRNVYLTPPPTDLETMSIAGGILGCTMVINKALAELLQSREAPDIMVMHDFYIALVCRLAGGKVCFDMTPQMLYRQHGNNVVGASRSKAAALKDRICTVTKRAKVSVCDQAKTLIKQYPELGTWEQRKWLEKLSCPTLGNRMAIACARKTHYPNKNKAITLRLAMFLGNR
jgi:rhamnosyltransferase